jgi:hypothetical protein
MDLLYFLKARTAFLRHFYNVTSAPFKEAKRKIERAEAPFESHSAKYDGEPPFTTEWIVAAAVGGVRGLKRLMSTTTSRLSTRRNF